MEPLLEVRHISKEFRKKGLLKKAGGVRAVEDVSFQIMPGQCLGLIGESGSGKSTVARIIMGFEACDQGEVFLNGKRISGRKADRGTRKKIQMIFQNPESSLSPSLTIKQSLMDAIRYFDRSISVDTCSHRIREMFGTVRLAEEYLAKYPYELSGGECQRVCIAKALLREPELLLCDEATSALDVSVQKEIVKLLEDIQKELHMAVLFISHDIALVSNLCSEVLVMESGRLIEQGNASDIIQNPKEAGTKALLEAALQTII